MSFNIGSQNANVINNVQGNQTNHRVQNVTIGSTGEARAVLRQLRSEVDALSLDSKYAGEITRRLDEMDAELQQPEPDAASLGERLGPITEILTSSGALVSAGHGLGSAIARLANWLGPFGTAALRVLQG